VKTSSLSLKAQSCICNKRKSRPERYIKKITDEIYGKIYVLPAVHRYIPAFPSYKQQIN